MVITKIAELLTLSPFSDVLSGRYQEDFEIQSFKYLTKRYISTDSGSSSSNHNYICSKQKCIYIFLRFTAW